LGKPKNRVWIFWRAIMAKSAEEYEQELARLREELEQLRSRLALSQSAGASLFYSSGPAPSFTILGLEEMVLQVDGEGLIRFANSSMARLLGAPDKKEMLKTPLAQWDKGILGQGFLSSLVGAVKEAGQLCMLEKEYAQLPADSLPQRSGVEGAVTLRFVCSPAKDQVQIIVQDVTYSRWLEKSFSRYVSPKVIELLRKVPPADLLKVKRAELSVLFADLRGFTLISQELEPEKVCEMVNSYLSRMADCVEKYDGTVDKFVGDEIMAVFGAPLMQKDHALRALLCAVDMVREHGLWQEEQKRKNAPCPPVGIGIATGPVITGNIGHEKQMDYTVLGHTVNLAARLCAKAEGMEILTVKAAHESALKAMKEGVEFRDMPHLSFKPRGMMELKNVKEPVEVIRVISRHS